MNWVRERSGEDEWITELQSIEEAINCVYRNSRKEEDEPFTGRNGQSGD